MTGRRGGCGASSVVHPPPAPITAPAQASSPPRGRLHLGGLARTIMMPPPFDPGLRRGRRAQGRLPVGATPLRLSFPLRSLRETDFRRGGWGESPPPSFGWSLLRQAQDRLSPTGEDRVCRQRPPPARGFTWGGTPDTAPYANGNHLPAAHAALPLLTLNLFQGPLRRKRRLCGPQHGC